MKPKIVFFDIDGTIVTEHTHILSESTVNAIKALQKNHHYAFINTGRTKFNSLGEDYIQRLGFDGFSLGCGTMIIFEGKVLYRYDVPEDMHSFLVKALRKYHITGMLEGENDFYFDFQSPVNSFIEGLQKRYYGGKISEEQSMDYPGKVFSKFVTWNREESNLEGFVQTVSPYFDYIDREHGFSEFVPKNHSKATGMEYLLKHLHLSLDDCYAIGDSSNDIPMLDYAPHSILMGNGVEELKSKVEYVTEDIQKDGIEVALRHYGLISTDDERESNG